MKHLLFILSISILAGCSNNSGSDKKLIGAVKGKRGSHSEKPQIPFKINYDSLDSSVRNQIKMLDSIYGRTPYFTTVQNKKMFVVLKGKFNPDSAYYLPKFTGRFKYGIVDNDLNAILPCDYDKIYNPNLTMLNCMEIKKDNQVGLVDFTTHEILEPQFEYIIPPTETPSNSALGFKDGSWYKIEEQKKFKISKTDFSPVDLLTTLSFNVKDVNENLFYESYNIDEVEGPGYGFGVVFTPSYIEHLNIIPEVCDNLILPEQKVADFGTNEMNVKTDTVKSITDKIISFIVSFYNEGVDGRGFMEDSKKVIVYNKENKSFNSDNLNHKYDGYDNFCHVEGYKFVNDSTIEILGRNQTDTSKKSRYDFENGYSYKLITKDGEIKDLHCNRYYNFTKYLEINENYFQGCYAKWVNENNMGDSNNVWVSEHLTLDDLDLMTNEIYADYGLKFKTGKWQTYFSQFSWYKPQSDNVDTKLTAIDKKNIATIAREKAKMKGKENDYVKKHKETYWAAG